MAAAEVAEVLALLGQPPRIPSRPSRPSDKLVHVSAADAKKDTARELATQETANLSDSLGKVNTEAFATLKTADLKGIRKTLESARKTISTGRRGQVHRVW